MGLADCATEVADSEGACGLAPTPSRRVTVTDLGWVERVESALVDIDVLSLDIFDTALTRTLESPVDVFALTEARLVQLLGDEARGYAKSREDAERAARAAEVRVEDVRFDAIIDRLVTHKPELARHRKLIGEEEIRAEELVLRATPDVLAAYRRARELGCRIIFVSDMYHSTETLAKWLRKHGYDHWDELLVSGDIGLTKARGTIWSHIQDRIGPLDRILHIGDDSWSDEERPRQAGVNVLPYVAVRSERRFGAKLTPALLAHSFASRAEVIHPRPGGETKPAARHFFYGLGASFGSVVVGGFIRWLEQRAKALDVKHLYFCSRDGWLSHAAWLAAGLDRSGPSSSYLHISRQTLNLSAGYAESRNGRLSEELLSFLSGSWSAAPLATILGRCGLDGIDSIVASAKDEIGPLEAPLSRAEDVEKLKLILFRESRAVLDLLGPVHEATLAYLRQEGLSEDEHRALVDAGWHGSLQASIRQLMQSQGLRPRLSGFYYGLWPAARGRRLATGWMEGFVGSDYRTLSEQSGLHGVVDILEELFAAPHGTVVGYESGKGAAWSAVLSNRSEEMRQHDQAVVYFQQGVIETLREVFANGRSDCLRVENLTRDAAMAAIEQLGMAPTSLEIQHVGNLQHAADFDHSCFRPLLHLDERLALPEVADRISHSPWPAAIAKAIYQRSNPEDRPKVREAVLSRLAYLGERRLRSFH